MTLSGGAPLKYLSLTPIHSLKSSVTREVIEMSGYAFEQELLGEIVSLIFK